jgi:Uma2 family endonuclease
VSAARVEVQGTRPAGITHFLLNGETEMSTLVGRAAREVETPEPDPFRYGWRDVRRILPDGRVALDQVPLNLEDVLHPEPGDVIVENSAHEGIRTYLSIVLRARLAHEAGALVLSDCRVAWDVPGLRAHSPDVSVLFGVRRVREKWSTFDVAEEGVRPTLIVEITSPDPDTRTNDLGAKLDHYHRAGVPFYVIIDEDESSGTRALRLLGYRHTPAGYEPLPPDDRGRLWLEPVGLWLALREGQVRFDDGQTGAEIGDYTEQFEARDAAEQARAAMEAARVAAEARAEAAETRLRELEAELRRLRGDD